MEPPVGLQIYLVATLILHFGLAIPCVISIIRDFKRAKLTSKAIQLIATLNFAYFAVDLLVITLVQGLHAPAPIPAIAFCAAGLVLAIWLFILRNGSKLAYGVVEMAAGIAILAALGARYQTSDVIASIIAFVGAVYVLVRGAANVQESGALLQPPKIRDAAASRQKRK